MKRIAWLFLVVLCSAILLNAEDQNMMSGWVCDSKCVVQSGDTATCNPNCTERSGDAVFIDDSGTVTKIANPAFCASYMNKRVKAKGSMVKDDTSDQYLMRLDILRGEEAPG